MPTITFITPDGERHQVDAKPGISVMQAAMANDIGGIVAECGGSAMCATCHVYVGDDHADRLDPVGEVEHEMLECTTSERTGNSRLSCQIEVSDELDGLEVYLPESQV